MSKGKYLAAFWGLLLVIGFVSPYIPEIHVGPVKPDVIKPEPKKQPEIWDTTKIGLMLKADGFATAAKKTDAGEFKSDQELLKFIEAMTQSASEAVNKPQLERMDAAFKDLSVTEETQRPKISAFLMKLSKEYTEAASE